MARGAKSGENRFKNAQQSLVNYRLNRLNNCVVDKLKTIAMHSTVSSINKFCHLAQDIYNDGLPVNEKPISYRRLKTNPDYWNIIGPVFYKYFEKKPDLEHFKNEANKASMKVEIEHLKEELEKSKKENRVLSLALENSGSNETSDAPVANDKYNLLLKEHDNLCKIIELLINKYQVVEIDFDAVALRDRADTLEDDEGMLPTDIVKPFIDWLINKNEKFDGVQ
tara:strand:- start:639 stop:1310 length:672 start_codon:yes stop_codon:yes gene_type:complete